jgi:DNA-directed RNA polymerase specialized sigma24 family protein
LARLAEEKTREVALLKLEGYENREIAQRLDISLSSVERKLRVIREAWQDEFGPAST